jgi:hypothetical protein
VLPSMWRLGTWAPLFAGEASWQRARWSLMTTSIHNAPRWQGPKGNKTEHFATYRYKDR